MHELKYLTDRQLDKQTDRLVTTER